MALFFLSQFILGTARYKSLSLTATLQHGWAPESDSASRFRALPIQWLLLIVGSILDFCQAPFHPRPNRYQSSHAHWISDWKRLFVHTRGFTNSPLQKIIPIVDGSVVLDAVRRVNVGGKLLTNLLKETLSFRQMNVQDCFHLVNKIKEAYSYLSLDMLRGRALLSVRSRSRKLQAASRTL